MKHTATWLLAGAHLTAGGVLVHAATVTVNHGGALAYAAAFYTAAALSAAAAYGTATGTRRPPARTRPGTAAEDLAALTTHRGDHRQTALSTDQDT